MNSLILEIIRRPRNAVAETATEHVAVAIAVAVAVSVAVCSKTATSETLYEVLQVDSNIDFVKYRGSSLFYWRTEYTTSGRKTCS